jgi:hypothetical protein
MQPADLAAAGFERVYGTNMHHAFLLARRVLADDPRPVKRVMMVTDGEPTAHLVDGRSMFNWPPVPETLEATLREAGASPAPASSSTSSCSRTRRGCSPSPSGSPRSPAARCSA